MKQEATLTDVPISASLLTGENEELIFPVALVNGELFFSKNENGLQPVAGQYQKATLIQDFRNLSLVEVRGNHQVFLVA